MITEVCQMIKAIKANDQEKAMSYAKLLAENMEKAGQTKEAMRIRRAINGEIGGNIIVMDCEEFPGIYPPGPRVRF